MSTEKIIVKGSHYCGKTDYATKGRFNCPANITWELRETEKGVTFSAQAEIWQANKADCYCCGQCVDTVAALFPRDGRAQEIKAVWERWHLNDMRAGCEHQSRQDHATKELTLYYFRLAPHVCDTVKAAKDRARECIKTGHTFTPTAEETRLANLPDKITWHLPELPLKSAPDYVPNGPQYEKDSYNRASETKLANWVTPEEHPDGLLGKKCAICGYSYGSAWLHEPIPAEVIAQIKSWAAKPETVAA